MYSNKSTFVTQALHFQYYYTTMDFKILQSMHKSIIPKYNENNPLLTNYKRIVEAKRQRKRAILTRENSFLIGQTSLYVYTALQYI